MIHIGEPHFFQAVCADTFAHDVVLVDGHQEAAVSDRLWAAMAVGIKQLALEPAVIREATERQELGRFVRAMRERLAPRLNATQRA